MCGCAVGGQAGGLTGAASSSASWCTQTAWFRKKPQHPQHARVLTGCVQAAHLQWPKHVLKGGTPQGQAQQHVHSHSVCGSQCTVQAAHLQRPKHVLKGDARHGEHRHVAARNHGRLGRGVWGASGFQFQSVSVSECLRVMGNKGLRAVRMQRSMPAANCKMKQQRPCTAAAEGPSRRTHNTQNTVRPHQPPTALKGSAHSTQYHQASPAARWRPAGGARQSIGRVPSTAPRAPQRQTPPCAAWSQRRCPGGVGVVCARECAGVCVWEGGCRVSLTEAEAPLRSMVATTDGALGVVGCVHWCLPCHDPGTLDGSKQCTGSELAPPPPPLPRCGMRPRRRPGGRCTRRRGGAPGGGSLCAWILY